MSTQARHRQVDYKHARRAIELLEKINEIGAAGAVYASSEGKLLARPVYTRAGELSKWVDAAIRRDVLIGIYDNTCEIAWLADDIRDYEETYYGRQAA